MQEGGHRESVKPEKVDACHNPVLSMTSHAGVDTKHSMQERQALLLLRTAQTCNPHTNPTKCVHTGFFLMLAITMVLVSMFSQNSSVPVSGATNSYYLVWLFIWVVGTGSSDRACVRCE